MRRWMMSFLGVTLSLSVVADPLEIVGNQSVDIPSNDLGNSRSAVAKKQTIYLQKIKLSTDARRIIAARAKEVRDNPVLRYAKKASTQSKAGPHMKYVPVLFQGVHGSCVTFAITGAIDAIIPGITSKAKADYVSQLCSLQLGNYLASKRLIRYHGWDGAYSNDIFKQLGTYGIISTDYQKKYGCAGLKKYPAYEPNNRGTNMSIAAYTAVSVPLSRYVGWASIFGYSDVFNVNYDPDRSLNLVKKHLREGKNLVFGMMLDGSVPGSVGAYGRRVLNNDTWVLTPQLIQKAQYSGLNAGHEMIIIGYDDAATASFKNAQGQIVKQKGLLILRNSWGARAGDGGNYYVSYDYFKAFAMDAQVLCSAKVHRASAGTCSGSDIQPVRK